MVTAFVDEPARVTEAHMDRWCSEFDSRGICDTLCFHLFDRTPHAWAKVAQWADRKAEFSSEEDTSELQSLAYLICPLLLEKKNGKTRPAPSPVQSGARRLPNAIDSSTANSIANVLRLTSFAVTSVPHPCRADTLPSPSSQS